MTDQTPIQPTRYLSGDRIVLTADRAMFTGVSGPIPSTVPVRRGATGTVNDVQPDGDLDVTWDGAGDGLVLPGLVRPESLVTPGLVRPGGQPGAAPSDRLAAVVALLDTADDDLAAHSEQEGGDADYRGRDSMWRLVTDLLADLRSAAEGTRIYARLTADGTAAAETAVCDRHLAASAPSDDTLGEPVDCSGNEALRCGVCGRSSGLLRVHP